uniref:Uncharacterized protein n=2 Tax=Meloidogyne TaxID=189290 RepID=A0A6V7WZM7_MELEN|nr:unnamed protein product [Meloidogyne enterolobii]
MPKADDSVAASGRTLRSSTTSATSTSSAGNETALMPAPSTPALSTSSQHTPRTYNLMALKHQQLHEDKILLRCVLNEIWTATIW